MMIVLSNRGGSVLESSKDKRPSNGSFAFASDADAFSQNYLLRGDNPSARRDKAGIACDARKIRAVERD